MPQDLGARIAVMGVLKCSRTPRSNSLSLLQRRNLQLIPLGTPTKRSGIGARGMATERHDSDFDDPGSSADRSFTSLVAIRGDHDS